MVDMDGIAGMADMDGTGMVDMDGIGVMTWGTIGIGGGDASKWTWANARPAHTKKQATQAVRCRAVDTLPEAKQRYSDRSAQICKCCLTK
jgi:hypothetical protein